MAEDLEGKVLLMTGATDGLGKAAAHEFARRGATLVLVGRSREKSERVVQEIVAQANPAAYHPKLVVRYTGHIAIALAEPSIKQTTRTMTVFFVVDRSALRSPDDASAARARGVDAGGLLADSGSTGTELVERWPRCGG